MTHINTLNELNARAAPRAHGELPSMFGFFLLVPARSAAATMTIVTDVVPPA